MLSNPYEQINPDKKLIELLEFLTSNKSWDSKQFSEILKVLGLLEGKQSIPARNRPESIHLQSFRPFFEDLLKKTKETNNEHARAVFTDIEQDKVLVGKITRGTEKNTLLDLNSQKGREIYQQLVGSMHTHPYNEFTRHSAHGLSGQDYKTFLSDKRQQFMTIMFGENVRIMVIKTSVTPYINKQQVLDQKINEIEREFFGSLTKSPEIIYKAITDFNKTVCVEFGLTFYMADKKSNDLFLRVSVVE